MAVVACTVGAAMVATMARASTTTATDKVVLATTAAAIIIAFGRVSGTELAHTGVITTTGTSTTRTAMAHAGIAITSDMALVNRTIV